LGSRAQSASPPDFFRENNCGLSIQGFSMTGTPADFELRPFQIFSFKFSAPKTENLKRETAPAMIPPP
jgi:hypothetical protein